MKKIFVILVLMFTLVLTSCSHIEDINGPDDYSLATYKEDELLDIRSCIQGGVVTSSSNILGKLKGSYKVSKISGITEIVEYHSSNVVITFDIEVICESGNALVIIVSNNEIIKKIEPNQSLTFEFNSGTYRMYLIGESAKVTIKYNIES